MYLKSNIQCSLLWGQVGESYDTIQKKAIRTLTYSH